jgi:hypothetical protein
MQLLAPDILAEARQLSPGVIGVGLALGLFLWLWGGRTHRFWLSLVMTLGAGVLGLYFGPAYGMQPLVAGLLLAVAAGALALSLVRVLIFASAGLAALGLAQTVAPNWSWQQPLVCFLAGGLIGVFLYRFWITTLASFVGTLLTAYSGLCLLDHFGKIDTAAWAGAHTPLLNWAIGACTVLGLLMQFLLERHRKRKEKQKSEDKARAEEEARRPPPPPPPKPAPKPWYAWPAKFLRRRAA